MDTKEITTTAELKDGAEQGRIIAAFSTFDVVDTDGDIVTASAFTDGQMVPMVWAHQWDQPIGAGTVKVDGNRAIFDGQLWLDTIAGGEAYKRIRHSGPMQEYSWGFKVLDSDYVEHEGKQVRVIKGAEVYEVSPVLVGAAGRNRTETIAIKSGLPLADQSEQVLAACREMVKRLGSLAELRRKEGRVLSATNRDRLAQHLELHRQMADELQGMLAATAPAKALDDGAARRWSLLVASSMETFGLTAD